MNIVLAEDDRVTRELLEYYCRQWGYEVNSASNGLEAWDLICRAKVDLVISRRVMPKLDGLELLRRIRQATFDHYIYMILICEKIELDAADQTPCSAADDFLLQPVELEALKARLAIGARVLRLTTELNQRRQLIEKNHFQMIRMLVQLMGSFDEKLGSHCQRVGQLALELAQRHGHVPEEDWNLAYNAGLLHDIGMVGLPPSILVKRRTEMIGDEQKQYQSHCIRGELILNEIESLWPVAKIVRQHHEQYNGKGFPEGLQGLQIPIVSQIVAAASIYDNLLHRACVPLQGLCDRLQRLRGYQLDPGIVDRLIAYSLEKMQLETHKDHVAVDIDNLLEGMLLAQDIQTKSGAMVMAAGMRLSAYGINKLKTCSHLSAIARQVFIAKDSIRG
jgi:response regulator RpfG family c-di-GMP phosphodiesterase